MTVLALDVGEARIGIAVGQLDSKFVFGRGVIVRQQNKTDIEAVKAKVTQENAELVVVGLPLRHDGDDSEQTRRVRDFAKALEIANLRVVFEDERFSSKLAIKNISKSGLSKKKRQEKARVDEAAAVLILESYLARQINLSTLNNECI